MERNMNSLKFERESYALSTIHESSRCGTCGEKFETALLAMVSSGYLTEEYSACPKCLSKVKGIERQKSVEVYEADEENKESLEMEVEDKMEEIVDCTHHLGYLMRRPKSTPIPDECLTCMKMIECMY
jgi:DNA-directed RNA polymerase subunit RPC12/RpoP